MEKVRPWCGQPSDRGRLKNRTEQLGSSSVFDMPQAQLSMWGCDYILLENERRFQVYCSGCRVHPDAFQTDVGKSTKARVRVTMDRAVCYKPTAVRHAASHACTVH